MAEGRESPSFRAGEDVNEPATERDERDRPLTREELAPYNARRLTPAQHAARLRAHPRDGLPVVERREDLPAGMSFEEARAFWDTHRPGEGLVGPPRAARAGARRPRRSGCAWRPTRCTGCGAWPRRRGRSTRPC